ncbi:hypothetical protein GQX74_015439 [Glossina fuscipes]|nr:hypothetical protein GQX74_015439 [Glossina fuscipes]
MNIVVGNHIDLFYQLFALSKALVKGQLASRAQNCYPKTVRQRSRTTLSIAAETVKYWSMLTSEKSVYIETFKSNTFWNDTMNLCVGTMLMFTTQKTLLDGSRFLLNLKQWENGEDGKLFPYIDIARRVNKREKRHCSNQKQQPANGKQSVLYGVKEYKKKLNYKLMPCGEHRFGLCRSGSYNFPASEQQNGFILQILQEKVVLYKILDNILTSSGESAAFSCRVEGISGEESSIDIMISLTDFNASLIPNEFFTNYRNGSCLSCPAKVMHMRKGLSETKLWAKDALLCSIQF